jgi:L-aminoadipate-semialdehyde dehydrogenase
MLIMVSSVLRLKHMAEWLLPTDYPRPLPMKVVEADKTLSLPDPICLRLLQLSLSLTVNYLSLL